MTAVPGAGGRPGVARPRVVVVGAGVAGLASAWELGKVLGERGGEVLVLEAAHRAGGALAPVALDVPADEDGPEVRVVLDGGGESLLARRTEAVGLAIDVGLTADLVTPAATRAVVASRGALEPMPRGTLMGVPSAAGSLAGLLDRDEVARAGAEEPSAPVDGDVDVASWVGARLGPAVVDRLVDPLLGGVYAGSAASLSLRATLPALWPAAHDGAPVLPAVAAATTVAGAATRSAVAGGAVGASGAVGEAVFAGIRGGVWRLAEALAAALPRVGGSVRLGAAVSAVEQVGSRWRVRVRPADGAAGGAAGPGTADDVVEADAVVLAVPPHVAAPLLAAVAPAAADLLGAVPAASLAIVTAVLPAGTLAAADGLEGLSGVLVPPVEARTVKAMTFSSVKWAWVGQAAGGRDVVRASVGRYGEGAVLRHDDETLARLVLADAGDLLGADLAPVATAVTRWDRALPQYVPGHVDRVAAVRAAVDGIPGLALAGAFFDGVGVPATIASARRAAARVLVGLG